MRKLVALLFVLVSISLPIPQVHAQIVVRNIGLNTEARIGGAYSVEINFKAPTKITVTAYMVNKENEKLTGTSKVVEGNSKNGKWLISWRIPSNARAGAYKLFIEARAGKSVWRTQSKTVQIVVNPEIVPAPIPSVEEKLQFGLKATCGVGLQACPISLVANQTLPVASCKIKDATFPQDYSDGYVSSGFPPTPYSLAGQKEINLLWIPVNFADRQIPSSLYEQAKIIGSQSEDYYGFNSYGRVKLNVILPSIKDSVQLPYSVKYYEDLWSAGTTNVTQFLLDQVPPLSDNKIDAVVWLFPPGKYKLVQKPTSGRTTFYSVGGNSLPAARVYGLHREIEATTEVVGFDHGLGHALYSFEDLYISPFYSTSGKTEQPGNGWDVMIGGGEFFAWTRWIAGWLQDSEVICLEPKREPVIVYIKTLQDPDGPKLISIPLSESKVVLAEYRTNTTKTVLQKYAICTKVSGNQCRYPYKFSGLLLYNLDTNRSHANAPFRVARTVDERLLEVGDSAFYEGFNFEVKAADAEGIYVEIYR